MRVWAVLTFFGAGSFSMTMTFFLETLAHAMQTLLFLGTNHDKNHTILRHKSNDPLEQVKDEVFGNSLTRIALAYMMQASQSWRRTGHARRDRQKRCVAPQGLGLRGRGIETAHTFFDVLRLKVLSKGEELLGKVSNR